MKKVFLSLILISSLLLASSDKDNNDQKKKRVQKQVEKQMKKEEKYSKEQVFYTEKNYDFKGAEVNEESVKSIPDIEMDDLDMDSVYD